MKTRMKEGDVVVTNDQVAGTIIGKTDNELMLLTKAGYIRNVHESEVYPYQDGIELKEENDVGSKNQTAPRKR